MNYQRILVLLFCLAIIFAGCSLRAQPAIEPTPSPTAAVPDETPAPTPSPEPTPSPAPTPEPTPCPHERWEDGVCAACGTPCSHPGWEAGLCTVCGTACPHEHWEDGVCTLCGGVCAHPAWEDGHCAVCGTACRHPSHDAATLVCSQCGEVVPHNFLNSECDMCGTKPVFTHDALERNMFTHPAPAGRVQVLNYLTHDYYTEGQTWGYAPLTKSITVYLPADYDPAEKYDVMILVHGTGGTSSYWLLDAQQVINEPGYGVYTTNLLDYLMATGYCRKMIIATPTFYRDSDNQGDYQRLRDEEQFLLELRNDIMPFLVSTYSTYAASPAIEDICAARNHFAYAGLSMGSIYAYTSIMPECLDMFAWFGCFSGSEANINQLIDDMNSERNRQYPILYFYNSCGGSDDMLSGHLSDYRALVAAVDGLTDGKNAAFTEIRMTNHSYRAWGTGLYNFLRVVFAQPEEE